MLLWWTPVVFVCLEHSLSFGNCPSSSRDIQVELSIPEPPAAQVAVATGRAHYSGLVSHTTSKLIGCAKPFSPFLEFAIQTPEESRFLSLSLSAIGGGLGTSLPHGESLSAEGSQTTPLGETGASRAKC